MTRWVLRQVDRESARRLAGILGVREVTASLLLTRGVTGRAEAEKFFAPSLGDGHDPFRMKGMERAVEVLVAAARAGEKIVVFGDYDVDGITAVAQLRAVFRALGADSVPFLPHRVRDGYGLRPETFRKVYEQHRPGAIVTVDCGITAVEAVREAARAGVSVVITDHHLPPDVLPEGASVVNPRQPGCPYPFKELCGSGVAFKIAQAVIRRAGLGLSEKSLVKLAALGTIADIVPLLSENRAIVAEGLAGLADPRAPGLRALLQEAGIVGRSPDAEEIAFRVGPRLNAAGRLDTADLALAVFEERDEARAQQIARELTERNAERQQHERRVVDSAREKLHRRGDPEKLAILVEADPGWNRGVLGIAAARLAREYHRPAVLFALADGSAVGSGRSVPGVPLHEILSELRPFFREFGGHAQACGGTIDRERFEEFRAAAEELFARRVPESARFPTIEADAEISLAEADEALLAELERFEPFGEGNPRPSFLLRGVRTTGPLKPVGERGRRAILRQGEATCRAIAWGLSARWDAVGDRPHDAILRIKRDRYTGGAEAEVVDLREAEG